MALPTWMALGSLLAALVAWPTCASTEARMVTRAKQLGPPAQNCRYGHTTMVPRKETFKVQDVHERGRWLAEGTTRRNAREIDLS
jgi:hypothetical protein